MSIAQLLQEGRIAGKPIGDPSPLGCYDMVARKQLTALRGIAVPS